MKAVFIDAPGKVVVKEMEKPYPKRGELLVEMKCCGICGTDLEKVKGQAVTPPILGHEVVGEVARVGESVKGFHPGDRVFTHHHAPCYSCGLCKRGEYTLCAEFPRHNITPGGFSEYYIVPEWNASRGAILPLPSSVSYEEGSFIEPIGCCLRALSKIGAESHRSAIIYGAGPVGLIHLLLLQHLGYRKVALADPSEYRLSFASKLGAQTFDPRDREERNSALRGFDDEGPEIAILATGSPAAFTDALGSVKPGGRVLLFGSPPRGSIVSLDISEYFMKGVTVVPSYSTSEKETALGVKMLEDRRIRVSELVTHRFELGEAREAFEVAEEQKCVKAVINS